MNPDIINFIIARESGEDNWLYFLGNLIELGSVIVFDRFEQKPLTVSPYYTVVPSCNKLSVYEEYILYNQKYLKEYTVFIKDNTIKYMDDYHNIINKLDRMIAESGEYLEIGKEECIMNRSTIKKLYT